MLLKDVDPSRQREHKIHFLSGRHFKANLLFIAAGFDHFNIYMGVDFNFRNFINGILNGINACGAARPLAYRPY